MWEELIKAIGAGDTKKAAELILKIDREELSKKGGLCDMTALHTAAQLGRKEICEKILEKAPEAIDAVAQGNIRVLHNAAVSGNREVYELILAYNNDPKAINTIAKGGITVLHYALLGNNQEIIISILDKHPVLYTFPNPRNYTQPYPYIASNKNFQIVKKIKELEFATFNKLLLLKEIIYGFTGYHFKDCVNEIFQISSKIQYLQTVDLKKQLGAKVETPASHKSSLTDQHKIQLTNIGFESSNSTNVKNQNAIGTLEKNCSIPEKSLESLVQQPQREETMSKQTTELKVNDLNTAEKFTNDVIELAVALESLSLKEKDSTIVLLEENRYEKRLDFKDKKSEALTALNWRDWRKSDLQRTEEIETFFKENADARSLDLSGNPLGSHRSSVATLKYLKTTTNLTDLNLSSCNAHTYPWAKGIAEFLTKNTTLTSLNLANNEICGTVIIAALAKALENNSTLTSLNLSKNGIGGVTDAEAFADMLKANTTLTDLNLADNEIIKLSWEDALSEALKVNTTLKTLNLLGNNIKSGALPLEEIKAKVLIAPSDKENGFFLLEEAWLEHMKLVTLAGLSDEWQGESNES